MKKLLGAENIGGRIQRDWLHYGDDGRPRITTETVQDVAPVFDYVKADRAPMKDMKYKATIPHTVIEDVAKINAAKWGITKAAAFREIMGGKTDRAQAVMRELLYGQDYRKLQAG